MIEPIIINLKRTGDRPYMAGLHKHKIGVYAPSLLAAKQKAVEYFQPKKRDKNLIWVEPAEES